MNWKGYTAVAASAMTFLAVHGVSPAAGQEQGAQRQPSSRAGRQAEAYYQFMLGRHYESEGDLTKAIEAFEAAARLDTSSAEAFAELSALHARGDRAREAIDAAERALAIDPGNSEANRVLGFVYASLARLDHEGRPSDAGAAGNAALAIKHLEAARRPNRVADVGAELALGRLYMGTGAYDKAISSLRAIVDQEPERGDAISLLAAAYRDAGRGDEAVSLLKAAVGGHPSLLPTLAEIYERRELWANAVEVYERAVAIQPRSVALKIRLGFASLQLGDPAAAVRAFREARKQDPDNPSVDMYLAQALVAEGEHAEALSVVEALRKSRPGDRRIRRLAAEALRQAGRPEESIEILEQDLAENQDDPLAYIALSEAHASGGHYDKALEVVAAGTSRLPDSLDIVFQRGALHERRKDFGAAEQAFEDVIARDPRHAQALNYLGYMLAERGERLEEATSYISRALEVEPDNGAYLDSLGWAYFKADRLDLAEDYLLKAAERRSRDPAVLDHLGDLRFRQGRYADALAAWERALAGNREQVDTAELERKIGEARSKEPK